MGADSTSHSMRIETGGSFLIMGTVRLGGISQPNEVLIEHHGGLCFGTGERMSAHAGVHQGERADRREAAKGALGVQSHITADGWKALVDQTATLTHGWDQGGP